MTAQKVSPSVCCVPPADIVRVPRGCAHPVYEPTKACSAAFRADNCFSTTSRPFFSWSTIPDRFVISFLFPSPEIVSGTPSVTDAWRHATSRPEMRRAEYGGCNQKVQAVRMT
jgi:hypothetical protein